MHSGKCFHEKDCPCTFEGNDYSHNERVIEDCDQWLVYLVLPRHCTDAKKLLQCICIYGKI